MTAGLYSYVTTLSDLSRDGVIEAVTGFSELEFYEEGLSSVVTVERDSQDGNIFLANNGKVEASLYDMDTQLLLAHVPFAFAPSAERVLVIGLASGITLGSVTLHPAREIDLVELEPAVVAASHAFDEHNKRPLEDSRVRLIVNDVRNFLTLAPDSTYDLVSAQPSNPWLTGASNLFTKEFFELGKRKLRPEGVWVQWLQTYSMGTDDVRSLLATFADVYEHVRVFRVSPADLLVVGSQATLPLSVAAFQEIFQNDRVAEDLRTISVERPEHLLGLHQFARDTLLELAGKETRNTDDNMRIEYSAPLKLFEDTLMANVNMLERRAEVTKEGVEDVEGLLALACTYADHDPSWRRAFETLQYARRQYPEHPDIIVAYEEAREKVRVEQE
jgi:spermidine synthase